MQHVGHGYPAGEVAINIDVVGIKHVGDIDHGGDGDAAFVHISIDGDVRVAVDNAGHDELAGGIYDLRVFRSFYGGADLGDFSVFDQDRTTLDGAVPDRQDGRV